MPEPPPSRRRGVAGEQVMLFYSWITSAVGYMVLAAFLFARWKGWIG